MSLINQVLSDLEKRGANALPGEASVRVVPVQKNRFRMALSVVAVLALVFMAAILWLSSSQHKTAVPVSVMQAPTAEPVAVPQVESQPAVEAVQEARREDSGQKIGGEVAGSAMRLSLELNSTPSPSSLRAKTVVAATEKHSNSSRAASPSIPAAGTLTARNDPYTGESKAPAATLVPDGTADETTSHSTVFSKDGNQVAGYNPAKNAGQVIGYSHSTKLANGARLAAGYASAPASGVDKSIKQVSVQQQADNEFRRANGLMQQGHTDDALAGYEAALQLDSNHDAARQAMVGVLLENKHNADAERVLEDGLKHNPKHSGFAMLLARLQVERDALPLAMDTLQRTLPYAHQQADYQAFIAALLQRQNRHAEAISRYQVVLQLSPNSGIWLMGLGISLQAAQRNEEARDAFKRAIESGNLSAELQAFVRQRLKEL